jgi:hypothetical protein
MRRIALATPFLFYWNALFTFENVPSTPALRLTPKLSVEILALVLVIAAFKGASSRSLSRPVRALLAFLLLFASVLRYVDVTAFGVLGREMDLYGDFPHVHRVAAMFFEVMTPSLAALVIVALLLIGAAAFTLNYVGLRTLDRALDPAATRRVAALATMAGIASFWVFPGRAFAPPVSSIAARQLGHLWEGASAPPDLAELDDPEVPLDSDLSRLGGAHVFLIFVESYGAVLFEDPRLFEGVVEERYREMELRLRGGGYHFSSSQIHSPTFGGGSWRAHATLLSGIEVRSEARYNALLASKRRTLVHALEHRGYRTVAAEPGIQWYWPDGRFYGFDRVYDFEAIGYRGPAMGWWKVPDQFTLYRMYQEEIVPAEKPLFLKASLLMTHIPYFPTPTYVPDWRRFDDGTAYEAPLKSVAHDAYRDLMELSSWYRNAVLYELDVLEGFLLGYVPERSLVIVVGDHQPPKLATHDSGSWAVPMHVFSKREELVRAFDQLSFRKGLLPPESALRMEDFLPQFLRIFDGGEDH